MIGDWQGNCLCIVFCSGKGDLQILLVRVVGRPNGSFRVSRQACPWASSHERCMGEEGKLANISARFYNLVIGARSSE